MFSGSNSIDMNEYSNSTQSMMLNQEQSTTFKPFVSTVKQPLQQPFQQQQQPFQQQHFYNPVPSSAQTTTAQVQLLAPPAFGVVSQQRLSSSALSRSRYAQPAPVFVAAESVPKSNGLLWG